MKEVDNTKTNVMPYYDARFARLSKSARKALLDLSYEQENVEPESDSKAK